MQLVQLFLPSPRDVPSRGGPADLTCSAEMNSACAKALLAQGACTALRAGVEQKQRGGRPYSASSSSFSVI